MNSSCDKTKRNPRVEAAMYKLQILRDDIQSVPQGGYLFIKKICSCCFLLVQIYSQGSLDAYKICFTVCKLNFCNGTGKWEM